MSFIQLAVEQVLPRDIARLIQSYLLLTGYARPIEPSANQSLVHLPKLLCMAISPDTRWVFAGTEEDEIYQWCVETGQCVWSATAGHESQVSQLLVSPDGTFLLSSGVDYQIKMWDLETKIKIDSVQVSGWEIKMALSGDAKVLYVLNRTNSRFTKIPLIHDGFGIPQDLTLSLPVFAFRFMISMGVLFCGSQILISDFEQTVSIQDLGTAQLVSIVSHPYGQFFFPDATNQLQPVTESADKTLSNHFQIVEPYLYVLSKHHVLCRWHLSAINQPPKQVMLPDWQGLHFCVSSDHRFLLGFCDWFLSQEFLQRRELITFVDSQ